LAHLEEISKGIGPKLAITAIALLATLLRVVGIDRVPLPLSDEVFAAVDWHDVVAYGHHMNGASAGALAYIVAVLDGRVLAFTHHGTLFDLRLAAAAFGVGLVVAMVPLGMEIASTRIGVLAAAIVAVMPWTIYFSRIFYPASEFALLTTLALIFALRTVRTQSLLTAVGCAVCFVLGVYIYPVAIASIPLVLACVVAVYPREVWRFGISRTASVALVVILLLAPYAFSHLLATDASVVGQNQVITQKMLWNHGVSIQAAIMQFVSQWLSFITPSFTVFHGDPNVRWGIQAIGAVGWVTGALGWVGVAIALGRRTRSDYLLLLLLITYPIPDAVTYFDGWANSVRGIIGAPIWALFAAVAVDTLWRTVTGLPRTAAVAFITTALAAQTLLFMSIYLGSYTTEYAYAFETGYPQTYSILAAHGLDQMPISLHAGYYRQEMFRYFSGYRLNVSEQFLACYDLPPDILSSANRPEVFVVREDPDVVHTPGCIHKGLIDRDLATLETSASQTMGQRMHVDLVAKYPDDVTHRYYTAIIYVHY